MNELWCQTAPLRPEPLVPKSRVAHAWGALPEGQSTSPSAGHALPPEEQSGFTDLRWGPRGQGQLV